MIDLLDRAAWSGYFARAPPEAWPMVITKKETRFLDVEPRIDMVLPILLRNVQGRC